MGLSIDSKSSRRSISVGSPYVSRKDVLFRATYEVMCTVPDFAQRQLGRHMENVLIFVIGINGIDHITHRMWKMNQDYCPGMVYCRNPEEYNIQK